MDAIDPSLMERAKPDFLDAIATFGKPGDDLYRVAQEIAQQAKMAGFSKRGRRWLLEHLYAFVDELLSRHVNAFLHGRLVEEPRSLFSLERLGGLFDRNIASITVEQPVAVQNETEEERERALIEQLIAATRLYESRASVKELMDFIIRLRAFAPFNAMLLHIQKPGLTYAATAADWHQRFDRVPILGRRPLLILRTMGPVDFVFDIQDTEGRDIPEGAFTFPTLGDLSEARFAQIIAIVGKDGIEFVKLDEGDAYAGWIRLTARSPSPKGKHHYKLAYNKNHSAQTRLVTIAHELAHLYLGHLGADPGRSVRDRSDRSHEQCEVEAEMAAYLVARRSGLKPRSESYLASYKGAMGDVDLYAVMRVANAIETAMGIAAHQLVQNNTVGAMA
jgi:hypothetical protein